MRSSRLAIGFQSKGEGSCNTFARHCFGLLQAKVPGAKSRAARTSDEGSRPAQRPPTPLNLGRKAAKCTTNRQEVRRPVFGVRAIQGGQDDQGYLHGRWR